ncbi:unnamed protein product [Protopolystoma xenopodis]|uniref:SAP domain-containing protein n=1 Tax=Protopolystoma xenopodis TaxID=117903 RepID=A0A3S5FCX6_9PLAT|nr:unnamed protein product [Protopolystoma xenopodis]
MPKPAIYDSPFALAPSMFSSGAYSGHTSHRLVGLVTKSVIGPMVKIGDEVAANAIHKPELPIKWTAEKVWLLGVDGSGSSDDREHKVIRPQRPDPPRPRRDSPLRYNDRKRTHERSSRSNKEVYVSPTSSRSILPQMSLANILSSSATVISKQSKPSIKVQRAVHPDRQFFVKVLLLSMPSMLDLYERVIVRAEAGGRPKGSLRKSIKLLASGRVNECFKAVGGPWIQELDGDDPMGTQTVINTAIRCCKELIGLDLSACTQWSRFLEFRYNLSESQPASSVDILFPGSDLWGSTFKSSSRIAGSISDKKDTDPRSIRKPYHRIVTYLIPDVWSLMPSPEAWEKIKESYTNPASVAKESFIKDSSESDLSNVTHSNESQPEDNSKLKVSEEQIQEINEKMDEVKKESTQFETATEPDEETLNDIEKVTIELKDSEKESFDDLVESSAASATNTSAGGATQVGEAENQVSELREQLASRNLNAAGVKAQLCQRLKQALEAEETEALENARKASEEGPFTYFFNSYSLTYLL